MNKTMKKLSKYFCLSALALGLWSCSKDDVVDLPVQTFEGNGALFNIQLCTPSNLTRGDVNEEDGGYKYGSADEYKVEYANFYFYDKYGDYVISYKKAKVEEGTFENGTDDLLVERIGKSKIILTGLLGKNYPSYVIAVLNYTVEEGQKDPFEQSLEQVRDITIKNNPWSNISGKLTNFVMTTATHDQNSRNFWYIATPITEENFALQPDGTVEGDPWNVEEEGIKPIDIYVERLASKVEVLFNSNSASKFTYNQEGGYYDATLKTQDGEKDSLITIDGKTKEVKLRIYGWGLNGVAKEEKFTKSVNDGVNPFVTSDGWDFNGTYRSYWAKTPQYGKGNYPSDFESVEDKEGQDLTQANKEPLKYISWTTVKNNKFKKDNDNIAYVMPHTESGARINLAGQVRHSAVTELLLAAQVLDSENKPIDMYEVNGNLYTAEGVKSYVLNSCGSHILKKTEWKYVDEDGNEVSEEDKDKEGVREVVTAIAQIDTVDISIVFDYDGSFKFQLSQEALTTQWYRTCDEVKDDNGEVIEYVMGQPYLNETSAENEVNSYLPAKQTWGYKDGMMYYNIPIRHLRNPYKEGDEILTGHFGVVRNHWYQITVGSIKNLGHAVYRPNEHIIPPSDDTRYMIGSKINILSWRMVKQTAEL